MHQIYRQMKALNEILFKRTTYQKSRVNLDWKSEGQDPCSWEPESFNCFEPGNYSASAGFPNRTHSYRNESGEGCTECDLASVKELWTLLRNVTTSSDVLFFLLVFFLHLTDMPEPSSSLVKRSSLCSSLC